MIKAIIFDCFGVLYPNPSNVFFERHQQIFGGEIELLDNLNFRLDLGEIDRQEFFQQLSSYIDIPPEQIRAEFDRELVVDKQIKDFIQVIKPSYKTGLLTNAGSGELDIFYQDKSDKLFDVIVISHELGMRKPDQPIYEKCLKELAVNPTEAIFIDDSLINLNAAEKIGIIPLHYTNFEQFRSEFSKLTGKNWGEL